jgi:hypothetical protein
MLWKAEQGLSENSIVLSGPPLRRRDDSAGSPAPFHQARNFRVAEQEHPMNESTQPDKQTVRDWLRQRRRAGTPPPPPIEQIRAALGWLPASSGTTPLALPRRAGAA